MIKANLLRKYAIVTGGTGGVGKEIAKMFNRNKVPVIITGRNKESTDRVADDLYRNKYPATDYPILGLQLDLNDSDSLDNFVNEIKKRNISIKYLINNAGILNLDKIDKINTKTLSLLFNVNTHGPISLSAKFKKEIVQNKGAILFNSPPYKIDQKTSRIMPYMQSKLAQTTFMKSLAHSISPHSALVSSFWTHYPLETDAILKRGVGTKEDCMLPSILAKTVEEMLWYTSPEIIHGREIVDAFFLSNRNISLERFFSGENHPPTLDDLFYDFLKKIDMLENIPLLTK